MAPRTPAGWFDLRQLFAALDAQRRLKGLSWSGALAEIRRGSRHGLSLSTLKGIGEKSFAEGDGVLQMLRWLGRTPESFVPGYPEEAGAALPDVASRKILRFDTRKLYRAIAAERDRRTLTWSQVAAETGWSVPALTRLSQGGRTGFPTVMRLFEWLKLPASRFIRASDR